MYKHVIYVLTIEELRTLVRAIPDSIGYTTYENGSEEMRIEVTNNQSPEDFACYVNIAGYDSNIISEKLS